MTLQEKIAQLYGVWVGASADGGEVARTSTTWRRPSTSTTFCRPAWASSPAPSAPPRSTRRSARSPCCAPRPASPRRTASASPPSRTRCLAGFAAWGATAYPVPLSWGATFDPDVIRRMAAAIGRDMRAVGVHQGLAPVLDVVRDARWGRVEETIGEDPYLVGTIGTAYVQGLESAGIVATLKHFVGYSASRAGRNLAPSSVGPRERADVLLPPFEMAIHEGGARSVMHAYTDIDGVPSAADETLLTGLLRDTWGFDGTVVADYFGIAFLKTLHGIAGDFADAAGAALKRGVDIELPTVKTFGAPLVEAVTEGRVPEDLIDRALRRVLTQKAELGLLDPDWARCRPLSTAPTWTTPTPCAAQSTWTGPGTANWPVRSPRRRSCCSATTAPCRWPAPPDRARRPQRHRAVGRPRLLLVPAARGREVPGHPGGHRTARPAREPDGRVPGRRDHGRPRHRRRRRRPLRHRGGGGHGA